MIFWMTWVATSRASYRRAPLGVRAIYVHLDATSESDWTDAVATAEREFGRLDILINNAGVTGRLGL